MKQRLQRIVRALLPALALCCLVLPFLVAESVDYAKTLHNPFIDVNQTLAITVLVVSLSLVLAIVLPGFLRLRTLSRRAKGMVLLGGLGFAALVTVALDPAAGGWVALGLTAQLAAGITWSERCHALLGGRPWQRVAWAVVGALVPVAVFPAVGLGVYAGFYMVLAKVLIPSAAILSGISFIILFAAAIHHLRARNRAQEWCLARETGEYPPLPQAAATPPPSEPS